MFRRVGDGGATGDVIAREVEALAGRPLLQLVMQGGRRLRPRPTLPQRRAEAAAAIGLLPRALHALEPARPATSIM